MSLLRKRKHVAEGESPNYHGDITIYGNISKVHDKKLSIKKQKVVHAKEKATTIPAASKVLIPGSNNKRKRCAESAPEGSLKDKILNKSQALETDHTQCVPTTPVRKRQKNVDCPSIQDTPSKKAAALFDNLNLQPTKRHVTAYGYYTPPTTPEQIDECLPEELQDIVCFQSAFISALSLYYAHHGSSSPVSMRDLLPMITSSWRSRTARLDDLRRVLALMKNEDPEFTLTVVAGSGICLTRIGLRDGQVAPTSDYLDRPVLVQRLEHKLQSIWRDWQKSAVTGDTVLQFLDRLPLAGIATQESDKLAPNRGMQRLAELKNSATTATQTKDAKPQLSSSPALQCRRVNLLDRILAKQAHNASLPAGPTKDQVERRAALQRIEDIARILNLLAASRSRCSFAMPALVQQLQQSLRNPINKNEASRCLHLMATEITPGFVSVVASGGVDVVVVTRGGMVELGLLRARVQRAIDETP